MKFLLVCFSLFFAFQQLGAQTIQGRLFVLNEGSSDVKGSVGYIDYYRCNQYTHIDSLPAYGNQVFMANDVLYAVDGFGGISYYDAKTNQKLGVLSGISARQAAVWNNQLLVTTNAKPFFRVYDIANNYAPLYSLDTSKVRSVAEGIHLLGDKALLAVNGFGSDSLVVVVDLLTKDVVKTIAVGRNPNNFVQIKDTVYVQSLNYQSLYGGVGLMIGKIDVASLQYHGSIIPNIESYGGFTASEDRIFFSRTDTLTFAASFYEYVAISNTVSQLSNGNYYGLLYDKTAQQLFTTSTDFFSSGSVSVLVNNQTTNTISTNISPRSLYFAPNFTPAGFSPFSFGADQTICTGAVNLNYSLPCYYSGIKWSDGTTAESFAITQPGVYSVSANAPDGTILNDTVKITFSSPTPITFSYTPGQIVLAIGPHPMSFTASDTTADSYVWEFGTTLLESVSGQNTPNPTVLYSDELGNNDSVLIILTTTKNGCSFADSVYIRSVVYDSRSDDQAAFQLNLFPNPSKGQISLQTDRQLFGAKVSLSDANGRLVFSQPYSPAIDFAHLPAGVYTLALETPNEGRVYRKVVKE